MAFLGIEIGGTKLQLGVGQAESRELLQLSRARVDVSKGAAGIVEQIETLGRPLLKSHKVTKVGIGFGGPVDIATGVVIKSHQVPGWDAFPLGDHLQTSFGLPVVIDNDCNVAALAEASLGAGKNANRVFYVTVGTGIGGGFVVKGRVDGNTRPAISEIGHLRPGPPAVDAATTVESIASGWGIEASARMFVQEDARSKDAQELLSACGNVLDALTTQHISTLSQNGNRLAKRAMDEAVRCLGWAIAQVVTILAPEVVVVGGGVSLIGDSFFVPLREHAREYSFAPLRDEFAVVPAELGEEVVVHGAILLAKSLSADAPL